MDTMTQSKLTEKDVKEARCRAILGESVSDMVEDYPVQGTALHNAIAGHSWKDVESPPPLEYVNGEWVGEKEYAGEDHADAKVDKETVKELRRKALNGYNCKDLVKEYPLSKGGVNKILNGARWAYVMSPPPLEYDRSKGEYKVQEGYAWDESEKEEQEEEKPKEQEQDTSGYDPSPVVQESSTDYTKYISIVAVVYMAYRVLRRLF